MERQAITKALKASIVIVTYNRPQAVQRCLECVVPQASGHQTILVDASESDETARVASAFPDVLYVKAEHGYGHMTRSRNLGLMQTVNEIVVFIDDDAFAKPNWLENLLAPYSDPEVGAVGGRALNLQPHEAETGLGEIGQLKPNGDLTGYFAADPGSIIYVDHIIGCNMSFRRALLAKLGGLREYPGTEVREETDTSMRVRKLGYKIVFNPAACVEHVGAAHPHKLWKRFDERYKFFAENNHMLLLFRNSGVTSPLPWRYFVRALVRAGVEFIWKLMAAFVNFGCACSGLFCGLFLGVLDCCRNRDSVTRSDTDGRKIRDTLKSLDVV